MMSLAKNNSIKGKMGGSLGFSPVTKGISSKEIYGVSPCKKMNGASHTSYAKKQLLPTMLLFPASETGSSGSKHQKRNQRTINP